MSEIDIEDQKAVRPGWVPNPINLSWGLGSLGTITMINSIATLYLFFLVSVLQMNPITAGTIIFVSKIFDCITDPLMGYISDRAVTKMGRRRPFMLAAAPLCGLSMMSLFLIPDIGNETLLAVYVFTMLIIYAAALTMYNVPYLAMPAEMTDDYHERSNIMSYRAAFLIGGSFVGSAVSGWLLGAFGGGRGAYEAVGVILGVFCFVTLLTAVIGTRKSRSTRFVKPTIPIINQFKLVFVNRPFLVLGSIKAIQFLQLSAGTTATLFFFVTVLDKSPAALFPFGIAAMLGSLLSLRAWLPIIHRIGKKETFMVGLILTVLVILSWLFATPQEPMFLFVLRGFFIGASSAGIVLCSQSMITDAIAYDREISGLNREGLFSSVFSFLEKTMYATGPLIIGTALTVFGFVPDIPKGQPQPESAIFAIFLGQVYIPVGCLVVIFILLQFYTLDEKTLKEAKRHAYGQDSDGQEAK